MKNIIIILITITLYSCATDKFLMSDEEMENTPYRTVGMSIMRDSTIIGNVSSTEIEVDSKGNKTLEISITLTGFDKSSEANEVIRYLHTRYPTRKIEVNLDGVRTFE